MNLKTLTAATCCLIPALTLADTQMRQGQHTCHFIHNRGGDIETKLTPCYITFNMYSANRVYYAYGYAERKNQPAELIPRGLTPPTTPGACVRTRQWYTVDCNLYDDENNVYKSREGAINVQVCRNASSGRYGDAPYDIYYRLSCAHGFKLSRDQAAAMDQAKAEVAEAASVWDDTVPASPMAVE